MPVDEPVRVLVWRYGGALLAVPLDAVLEVAAVTARAALSRHGELDLVGVRGLGPEVESPRRAIVLRTGGRMVAIPADAVEGVVEAERGRVGPAPRWLAGVDARHVKALVRLDPDRTAALLDVEAVGAP